MSKLSKSPIYNSSVSAQVIWDNINCSMSNSKLQRRWLFFSLSPFSKKTKHSRHLIRRKTPQTSNRHLHDFCAIFSLSHLCCGLTYLVYIYYYLNKILVFERRSRIKGLLYRNPNMSDKNGISHTIQRMPGRFPQVIREVLRPLSIISL